MGGLARGRFAPEYLEGLVEQWEVLLSVHQEAAGRLVEVLFAADGSVLGGADQVQHVARTNVKSQTPQHLGEQHQVVEDVAGIQFLTVVGR